MHGEAKSLQPLRCGDIACVKHKTLADLLRHSLFALGGGSVFWSLRVPRHSLPFEELRMRAAPVVSVAIDRVCVCV